MRQCSRCNQNGVPYKLRPTCKHTNCCLSISITASAAVSFTASITEPVASTNQQPASVIVAEPNASVNQQNALVNQLNESVKQLTPLVEQVHLSDQMIHWILNMPDEESDQIMDNLAKTFGVDMTMQRTAFNRERMRLNFIRGFN